MRVSASLLILALGAWAGPRTLVCQPDAAAATEIARTRGKMILLTVIIDSDAQNRAVVDEVLQDKSLQKTLEEFVLLYANPDETHGKVAVKDAAGKRLTRCADFPSIECKCHLFLAQSYARGFYGDKPVKTPVHFVLDAKEELLDTIFDGSFETGLNHVPAKTLGARLDALLKKRGRGLSEAQFERMRADLVDAKAARARKNTIEELKHLAAVAALEKDVEGVREAKGRIAELDGEAAKSLEAARTLVAEKRWEEALDALNQLGEGFPGTPTAAAALREAAALRAQAEVKRLLAAKECYERGLAFKEKKNLEQARKKFEECARKYPGTKYAEAAAREIAG